MARKIVDMARPKKGPAQIEDYRALIELRLSVLLEKYGSRFTVEDYKRAIFDGPDQTDFPSYLAKSLDVFGTDIEHASDEIVAIIQDAWNYFPHRALEGRCPAEMLSSQGQADMEAALEILDVDFDQQKIEDAVLALLMLGLHDGDEVLEEP